MSEDRATLSALVGEQVVAAERSPLGFSNRTDIVTLADGRRLVVQRLSDRERAAERLRLAEILPQRFAAAGLRLPQQLAANATADPPYAIREFISGQPGARLMGAVDGAVLVARLMGALLPRLAVVPTEGAALDDTWAHPERLAAAAESWLATCRTLLDDTQRDQVQATIAALAALFAGESAVFAHGDFCPVNVLLDEQHATAPQVVALLDVEHARLAGPLFDAARWGWVVRYHHEERWRVAWPELLAAGGIPNDQATAERIRTLQYLRCLELAAEGLSFDQQTGRMWADRLATTLSWN